MALVDDIEFYGRRGALTMSNSPHANEVLREIAYALSDYNHRLRAGDVRNPDATVSDQADRVAGLLEEKARHFRMAADAWRPDGISATPDAGGGS